MAEIYLMGIDIGTTTSKGVLVSENGMIISQHIIEHGVSRPKPNWAEHDADNIWWNDFCQISNMLLKNSQVPPSKVAAVSCSALYPVILPVDRLGKPLRPAILYGIDMRSTAQIMYFKETFGNNYSLQVSGNALSSQSIGPKILWLKQNEPDVFSKTEKILFPTGYITYRLTGSYVADHGSASLGGLPYDTVNCRWDEKSAKECGLQLSQLPELYWSGDLAGKVTAEAAAQTGLAVGTLVAVGTGDHCAEVLSLGAGKAGTAVASYGTTVGVDLCSSRLNPHPELTVCRTGLRGQYLVGGCSAAGAGLTKWFRDNFAQVEIELEKDGGENAYASLTKLAKKAPPGSDGLIALPYFDGERYPFFDPNATGAFIGLTLSHRREHIYRALLESVAYSIRHMSENLTDKGYVFEEMLAVGGGTQSKEWVQIVSDVSGYSQHVLQQTHGSSIGSAFLAGLCARVLSSKSIKEWNMVEHTVTPNEGNKKIYDARYKTYRALYPALLTIRKEI